jgi:hypothetical protein
MCRICMEAAMQKMQHMLLAWRAAAAVSSTTSNSTQSMKILTNSRRSRGSRQRQLQAHTRCRRDRLLHQAGAIRAQAAAAAATRHSPVALAAAAVKRLWQLGLLMSALKRRPSLRPLVMP